MATGKCKILCEADLVFLLDSADLDLASPDSLLEHSPGLSLIRILQGALGVIRQQLALPLRISVLPVCSDFDVGVRSVAVQGNQRRRSHLFWWCGD